MISPVFWIYSGEYGFQRVGKKYNVYDRNGGYLTEFDSFFDMCDWMVANDHGKHERRDDGQKVRF